MTHRAVVSSSHRVRTKRPRSLTRNLLTTVAAGFAIPFATIAVAPVLAHALGPDGRGEVAASTAILILLTAISSFGIPESATYWSAKYRGEYRVLTAFACAALLAIGVASTIVASLIASPLASGDPALSRLIIISVCFLTPTIVLAGLRGICAGHEDWGFVNMEKYLTAAARLFGIYGVFLFGELTPPIAAIVLSGAPLVGGLVYLGLIFARRATPKVARSRPRFRSMLSYGARVWIGIAGGAILARVAQVLLAPLSSVEQLGFYAVAINVSDATLIVSLAIRDVMFSSASHELDIGRLTLMARMSLLASAAVSLILSVTAIYWFPILFGEDFTPALPVLLILLLSSTLGASGSIAGAGLSGIGRPEIRSWIVVMSAATTIVLLLLIVPTMGAMGAAVGTMAGSMLCANLVIIFLNREIGTRFRDYYLIRIDDFRTLSVRMQHITVRVVNEGLRRIRGVERIRK